MSVFADLPLSFGGGRNMAVFADKAEVALEFDIVVGDRQVAVRALQVDRRAFDAGGSIVDTDDVETIDFDVVAAAREDNCAERRIALGRALRKGIVQQLAKEMVREEVNIAAIENRELSDELAEALLAACELPFAA